MHLIVGFLGKTCSCFPSYLGTSCTPKRLINRKAAGSETKLLILFYDTIIEYWKSELGVINALRLNKFLKERIFFFAYCHRSTTLSTTSAASVVSSIWESFITIGWWNLGSFSKHFILSSLLECL